MLNQVQYFYERSLTISVPSPIINFEKSIFFRKYSFNVVKCVELVNIRLSSNLSFLNDKYKTVKEFEYLNKHDGFQVVTNQEKELLINSVVRVKETKNNNFEIMYSKETQPEFCGERIKDQWMTRTT